jgi:hypothetical protein
MFQSEAAVFITKTMVLPSGDHAGFSYCAATAASAQPKASAAGFHMFTSVNATFAQCTVRVQWPLRRITYEVH